MAALIVPREIECKSALNKTGIPGYDYCMNPYVGCSHACVYCYASFMCRFTGHSEKWGEFLDVKVNFPAVLARQLSRRSKPQGRVLLGTVTDAYQPAEGRYRITRSSLEILADYGCLEPHILTKSALVERDIDVLERISGAEVGFTITTMDTQVARIVEPGASSPGRRLQASRRLQAAGIAVWVFIAPVLPGLSDGEQALASLFASLAEAGIRDIMLDHLNPYPAVVHRLKGIYRRYFPEALRDLEEYLRHPGACQMMIEDRLRRAAVQYGCRPEFV